MVEQCVPSIDGLKLSVDGIKKIKDIPELANKLADSMAGSQITSIFASPTPPLVTMYSIRSMDWYTFSQAMVAVPEIARASVVREAQSQ